MKNIAILTGGGDSSAINDFLKTLVILLNKNSFNAIGVKEAYKGLIEGSFTDLKPEDMLDISCTGGTILGTSRTNPEKIPGAYKKIEKNIESKKIDVLIAAGGNDTLSVAKRLSEKNINIIGIPQTIDNDLCCTDYSIGFITAVSNIVKAIKMILSSNVSHRKEMIVEVMGRDSGFLAVRSGLVLGADAVLIPEFKVDLERICSIIKARRKKGRKHGLFIISEGIKIAEAELIQDEVDVFGNIKLGGISYGLADLINKKTGIKPRVNVLGYIQRGGEADPYDVYLSNIFAKGALKGILESDFGKMVAVVSERPKPVPLKDAVAKVKLVDKDTYEFVNNIGNVYN